MNYLVRARANGNLVNNFDRVFDRFLNDVPGPFHKTPAVDVRELDDRYVLEAELPGMSEKDIDVKVEGNLLTISSVTNEEKDENLNGYMIRERHSNGFQRSFVLPKDVDATNISARFSNGLLTLDLQKTPEGKPRSIEIKSE